jgi:exopolyphosphatase/guanosine-5'-triphosphate,3'-diphosphate pyrophosphatase
MHRVLEELEHAGQDFAPDPVHDLRVALRRCRSLADGFIAMDPDPSWREMKKAGRNLFRSLGALRDIQVMEEWVRKIGQQDDAVTVALLTYFSRQEAELKRAAAVALSGFDPRQWKRWSFELPRRAAKLRPGLQMFKHLALERWTEARRLHSRALRNRSKVALHNLRIGIKRFRYVVENFLPALHEAWSTDLKELQDLLGEIHDLDVLWATALQVHAFPDQESRSRWEKRINEERARRITSYREKMLGDHSLWEVWRKELPQGEKIAAAALSRLKLWASHLDPDIGHSEQVARIALELYDGLRSGKNAPNAHRERSILQLAALMHDIGRSKGQKRHHKATYRLFQKLSPPLGWTSEDFRMAGIIARYHRGALPTAGQKTLIGLSPEQRQTAVRLAGVLRLADAFDGLHRGIVRHVAVETSDQVITIFAEGYLPRHRTAERVAAARHLLELTQRKPVLIKALRPSKSAGRGSPATGSARS